MVEAARRAEWDCYQKGRELGSGRFIPPPDAVIRMPDALRQRYCPTLTSQKSRPQRPV
jgi:hypothetical protein